MQIKRHGTIAYPDNRHRQAPTTQNKTTAHAHIEHEHFVSSLSCCLKLAVSLSQTKTNAQCSFEMFFTYTLLRTDTNVNIFQH